MKIVSKFMATTAIITMFAGGAALAQDAPDTDAGMPAEAATGGVGVDGRPPSPEAGATATGGATMTTTQGQTTADPTVGAGVAAETDATVSSGAAERTAPAGTADTGLQPETGASAAFTTATGGLERGERVEVISQDGVVLGHVSEASQDARGAAQLSIAIDPVLETNARNVTFIGMADVDADGRIVLPYAQEEFVSQIQAQFGDQG